MATPPGELHSRILRSVRAENASRGATSRQQESGSFWQVKFNPRRFGYALAFAGCLVFVAVRVGIYQQEESIAEQVEYSKVLVARLQQTAAQLNGNRLLKLGETLDTPLQTELDHMVKDALNAATALASNFLPDGNP